MLSSVFVAARTGKHLVRLALKDERVDGEERLLTELTARIHDVQEDPHGELSVTADRDGGKVLRLVPTQ